MAVSIGRLREDSQYDYKFVCLSHNTLRGAAGGAPEQLEQISEEEVLRRKWAYDGYTGTVPDDIMKLYHASVEKAREQLGEEEGGRS